MGGCRNLQVNALHQTSTEEYMACWMHTSTYVQYVCTPLTQTCVLAFYSSLIASCVVFFFFLLEIPRETHLRAEQMTC